MAAAQRRGVATQLRSFWAGRWWWLLPLALLILPTLLVLLLARAASLPAPFTYTPF